MKKLLLSALFSYCIVSAFAQTSTSVPNVVNPGISADKWSVITVVNAQRIDGKYIESKIMKGGGAIIFFRDFRFAVPSSATVKGIDVRVTRKKKGMNEVKDITVALLKPINDTEAMGKGPNLAKTEPWSEQLATVLYEFPDTAVDANGQTFYWSAKEINHPAFGLFLNPSVGAGKGASLLIDQVELTVKYTLPTTRQLQFQSVDKIIEIKNIGRNLQINAPLKGIYQVIVHNQSGTLLQQITIEGGGSRLVQLNDKCKGYCLVTVQGNGQVKTLQTFLQ